MCTQMCLPVPVPVPAAVFTGTGLVVIYDPTRRLATATTGGRAHCTLPAHCSTL